MAKDRDGDARGRRFDAVAIVITVLAIAVTVAFMNGGALGIQAVVDADAEAHSDDVYFTDNDLDGSWDTAGATTITLAGDAASVTGGGAYAWDGNVTIASSGTYVVTGDLDGGSLNVDADANSKVWILLDGVTVHNDDGACIMVNEADKVFLTLAEGSTNTLASGDTYSEEALADSIDGAIFARDDLTINGFGTLDVTAGYKHGIVGNDDLVITGGAISVDAQGDGVHANDSLRICDVTLDVTAKDDGLAVDNEGGYLYVRSGTIAIEAADEGMTAPGDVTIDGGDITIKTGIEQGHHGIKAGGTCTVGGGTLTVTECYEGIQAPYIDVTNGDVTVYPADDGLNASNGGSADGGMGMMGGGGPAGAMGINADGDAAGDMGGVRGGFAGGGMAGGFGELEGVTIDGDALTITAAGAQNIIDDAEARGLTVTSTVDDLVACTTVEELMSALGMDAGAMGGGMRGMGGGQGGMRRGAPGATPDAASGAQATNDDAQNSMGTPPDGGASPSGAGAQEDAEGTGGAGGPGGLADGVAPTAMGGAAPGDGNASGSGDPSGSSDADAAQQGMGAPPTMSVADEGDDGDAAGSKSADTPWIHVSGGTITIVNDSGRDADGLDSNGDIIISGGDIRVSLLGDGSNSAIDYGSESGGVCEISGGTVVACGGYSMAEGFDDTSTQCSLLYNFSSGAEAGTTVSLMDEAGATLLSYEAPCSFTSVNLSCPEMEVGGTYHVIIGDVAEEVTLDDTATSSGDAESTMFGGGFAAGGGMRDARGFGGRGAMGGSADSSAQADESSSAEGQPSSSASGEGQMPTPPDGASAGQGTPQMRDARPASGVDGTDEAASGPGAGTGAAAPGSASDGSGAPQGQQGAQEPDGNQQGGGFRWQQGDEAASSATQDATSGTAEDGATADDAAGAKAYTTETLMLCAASVGVLVTGLVVALLFRRH